MSLNSILRKLEYLAKKYFKKQRAIDRNGFYNGLQQVNLISGPQQFACLACVTRGTNTTKTTYRDVEICIAPVK